MKRTERGSREGESLSRLSVGRKYSGLGGNAFVCSLKLKSSITSNLPPFSATKGCLQGTESKHSISFATSNGFYLI